tara:strand:+ start:608 stop:2539 length:1932 start_codon:yes stop_codon:yes gene_type:complete
MASRVFDIVFRTKGTDQAKRNIDGVDNSISDLGVSANKAAVALGTALAASTAIVGSKAIRAASSFEDLRKGLQAITGSQREANRLFDSFNKIASETQFSVEEIVAAGKTLEAFQLDSEELIIPLSDLASFMQVDIGRAVENFGRAMAAGAGAADLFREKGVNQLVASFAGVENVSQLTLPEFRKALQEAIVDPSAGVAGATALMGETLTVKFANAEDAVTNLSAAIGEILLPGVKESLDVFTEFTKSIDPEAVLEYGTAIGVVTAGLALFTAAQNAANLSAKAFKLALPLIALGTATVAVKQIVSGLNDLKKQAESTRREIGLTFVGDGDTFEKATEILQDNSVVSKMTVGELVKLSKALTDQSVIEKQSFAAKKQLFEVNDLIIEQIRKRSGVDLESFKNQVDQKVVTDLQTFSIQQQANALQETADARNFVDEIEIFSEDETMQIMGYASAVDEVNVKTSEAAENFAKAKEEQQKFNEGLVAASSAFGTLGSAAQSTSQLLATLAGEDKDRQIVALQIARIAAIANIAQGVTKAFAQGGILGFASGASVTAAGAAQIATIDAQIAQLKKAQYGIDQMVSSPTLILAGEAGPERVQVTPSDRPASQQQGALTINFNGPVTSREFVRDTIIPEIDRVQKLGLA